MLQLVQLNKSQQKVYERLVSLPARSTVTVRCEREHLANGRMHEVIKIMGGVDRGHMWCTPHHGEYHHLKFYWRDGRFVSAKYYTTRLGNRSYRSIATAFNAYEAYVRGQATRA